MLDENETPLFRVSTIHGYYFDIINSKIESGASIFMQTKDGAEFKLWGNSYLGKCKLVITNYFRSGNHFTDGSVINCTGQPAEQTIYVYGTLKTFNGIITLTGKSQMLVSCPVTVNGGTLTLSGGYLIARKCQGATIAGNVTVGGASVLLLLADIAIGTSLYVLNLHGEVPCKMLSTFANFAINI